MFIYIDESGSFVRSDTSNSWNVVAALAVPEATRRRIGDRLKRLKISAGRTSAQEVKLRDLSETLVRSFVEDLASLNATLYASCIDAGLHGVGSVPEHRRTQVERIRWNGPRMVYQEGRDMIEDLATRVEGLSDQLYTQMVVQLDLLDQVYRSTTLYYSQFVPATLGSFRWRIDEKNSSRPIFEETMRHMAPPILQTRSLIEPAIFLVGADYSHFDRSFSYGPGEAPTHLGLSDAERASSADLGKILRDFEFVRSQDVDGVQVADLLASTLRRMLRGEFDDNHRMAEAIGKLTVQRPSSNPPVHLISLSHEHLPEEHVRAVAISMRRSAKPMLRVRRASR